METLEVIKISKSNARKLYNTIPEFKSTLEDTFGKEFFSGKITDRIKTYEDACTELGETPLNEKELRNLGFTTDEINYRKLKTVIKALNEGWVPDWTNTNQQKWAPYLRLSSGAFVFYDTYYLYSNAIAGYGSRLCFPSDELATYAGKQFEEIYKGFMF
jgi:hypothetical protein